MQIKSIRWVAILLLAVAAFAQGKPDEEQGGVKATVKKIEAADIADALGMKLWKYTIELPAGLDDLHAVVELREPGGAVTQINECATGGLIKAAMTKGKLVVAISFSDHHNAMRAEEMTCYLNAMICSDTETKPNPFKGASGFATMHPTKFENNEMVLMKCQTADHQDGPSLVLCLKM